MKEIIPISPAAQVIRIAPGRHHDSEGRTRKIWTDPIAGAYLNDKRKLAGLNFGNWSMKTNLLISCLFLMAIFSCNQEEPYICPMCIGPAFEITIMDTTGSKLIGFTIKATYKTGDTLTLSDSTRAFDPRDSTYVFYSAAGIYNLEISNPHYQTITLDSIKVENGRCGPNARVLGIIVREPTLSKKLNLPYVIAVDSSKKGCGN